MQTEWEYLKMNWNFKNIHLNEINRFITILSYKSLYIKFFSDGLVYFSILHSQKFRSPYWNGKIKKEILIFLPLLLEIIWKLLDLQRQLYFFGIKLTVYLGKYMFMYLIYFRWEIVISAIACEIMLFWITLAG